ncbi:transpeptidase family protein [Cryomorpha ignava]|uniref:Transpeptidase family protein n=1 Tax=Cryomorpha ignava TaxID=101383 RepID=A0A7K3WQ06_9FLAO|nr:penicillin-binding protein [Cryomorpha ignava]NEN22972.1 transpeptidase family protein [Cryomorpha ignava]
MKGENNIISKAYIVFIAICIFSLLIVGKILFIQFVNGEKWESKVAHITTDLREITPVRGNIYADNRNMLATSVPIYEIRMDMLADGLSDEDYFQNIDSLCVALSKLFDDKPASAYKAEFAKARKAGNRYYRVKSNVDYDQVQKAQDFPIWKRGRFKSGVIFEKRTIRLMPFKELANRTVGYEREGVQPVGIEGAYNSVLSGKPGARYEKRLAGGIWMPLTDHNEVEPEDGCDVYTTLDVNIQDVATNALRKELKNHNASHGCAVLMEVKTGYIKAIANLTRTADSTYREVYNYAVGEATEPGSTFKLASLMAAFEDGLIDLHDTIDTENGKYRFYDRIMRDSNGKGHGKIDVLEVFQKSSNVGVSRIINEKYASNPQRFVDRLYKMGLGRKLGLEISGEGKPKIKDPSDNSWSGVTLPWMSIGYETLMTPLQILTFYNAVANNGVMLKPQFVSEVQRNGIVIKENRPIVLNQAIASRETIAKARKMLESVVTEEGTAANLRFGAYHIAGKTGTAQIANEKYGYKYEQAVSYQASFVGYFPAEAPEYTCIVVVNGPSNDVYYANRVAGPVFKEIADKVYAQRFDLFKVKDPIENAIAYKAPVSLSGNAEDLKSIFSAFNVPVEDNSGGYGWVTTKTEPENVELERRTVKDGFTPNVVGMGLRDGVYLLESCGYEVKVQGKGMISKQSMPPGSPARKGQKITIELS